MDYFPLLESQKIELRMFMVILNDVDKNMYKVKYKL